MSKAMENLITYLTAKKASIPMVISFSDTVLMKFRLTNRPLCFYPFHIYFGVSFLLNAFWYSGIVVLMLLVSNLFNIKIPATLRKTDIALVVFSLSVGLPMLKYITVMKLKIPSWHELENGNINDYLPKPKLV